MESRTPDTDEAKRTLLDWADELFRYVLNVNRAAKLDPTRHPTFDTVRVDVRETIRRIQGGVAPHPEAARAFTMVEKPLYYFVDSMFADCERWSASQQWTMNPLQREEFGEMTGDQEFWSHFDRILEQARSGGEAERQALETMYAMVGLGFTGIYIGKSDVLRQKMSEAWHVLQNRYNVSMSRLCPKAYEDVMDVSVDPPAGLSLVRTAVILVVGVITILIATRALVQAARSEFDDVMETINKPEVPVQSPANDGEGDA